MPSYICETGCLWEEEGIYSPKRDFLAYRQGVPMVIGHQTFHATLCSDCLNAWDAFYEAQPLFHKAEDVNKKLLEAKKGETLPEVLAAAWTVCLAVNNEIRTLAAEWHQDRRKKIRKLNDEKYVELLKARQKNREAYHGPDAPKNW